MKKLKNLKLQESIEILNTQEMKLVVGGYSGGGYFRCSCDSSGANPPFKSSWTSYYAVTSTVASDVKRACVSSGSCTQVYL